MDRLLCGDVGFGKTKVALRAVAAAAFAGRQVVIVAPTTVVARQHFELFRHRFAKDHIEVAMLSRLQTSAELGKTRAGLADGTVRILVATHAVCGKDVAFKDLALAVIDEEQRFGSRHKKAMRKSGHRASRARDDGNAHSPYTSSRFYGSSRRHRDRHSSGAPSPYPNPCHTLRRGNDR